MKRYIIKTGGEETKVGEVFATIAILSDGFVTFYGGPDGEFRVALKEGWWLKEAEISKIIVPAEKKIVITDAGPEHLDQPIMRS